MRKSVQSDWMPQPTPGLSLPALLLRLPSLQHAMISSWPLTAAAACADLESPPVGSLDDMQDVLAVRHEFRLECLVPLLPVPSRSHVGKIL